MSLKSLAGLPNYNGILFDPSTGKTYTEEGVDTGFTFEVASWTGPFGLHYSWPWLNPISFATRDTALKVLQFAKNAVPRISVVMDEEKRVTGPFTRTVERSIVVSDGATEETFSAGMLANSIIRNGEKYASVLFQAEIRAAHIDTDPVNRKSS
ncbi:MAG: hypothetical protein JJE04_20080 [Acidobacteriia bacterium]|nr:hypothetical protein [Terriglobia bacterium]